MFPYSYLPETTSRNRRGVGLSKQHPPQTQECILWSHAHMNWICDLVQGQGPKMRHNSLWFPEFHEVLTSFLSRYSWKPLWKVYHSYGHSLGDYKHWALLSSTKATATAKPDPKAWKQHYKEIRSQRVDTEAVVANCACKNHLVKMWQQPAEQNWRTETEHTHIFWSNELALCKSGFMCMTFRHCQNKFPKCLGHVSSRLPARSSQITGSKSTLQTENNRQNIRSDRDQEPRLAIINPRPVLESMQKSICIHTLKISLGQ